MKPSYLLAVTRENKKNRYTNYELSEVRALVPARSTTVVVILLPVEERETATVPLPPGLLSWEWRHYRNNEKLTYIIVDNPLQTRRLRLMPGHLRRLTTDISFFVVS